MANIKLKDGQGQEQVYEGIDTINVPLADANENIDFYVEKYPLINNSVNWWNPTEDGNNRWAFLNVNSKNQMVLEASTTKNARQKVCRIEPGAQYKITVNNTNGSSTGRERIGTFNKSPDAICPVMVGQKENVNAEWNDVALKTIVHKTTSETVTYPYTHTFTNTENAKYLYMLVGWDGDFSKYTVTVEKLAKEMNIYE